MTEENSMAKGEPGNASVNLQVALEDVPDIFLECRDMRHWWEEVDALHITESGPDGDLVARNSKCKRGCGTLKSEVYLLRMDRWGVQRLEFIRTSYEYPQGYLMPAMAQAEHPREILRFEQMRRKLGKVPKATTRKS